MVQNPQYIIDKSGKKISVIITLKEYQTLLEESELKEDIRAYDKAKANDDGSRILLSDYLKKRKLRNLNSIFRLTGLRIGFYQLA